MERTVALKSFVDALNHYLDVRSDTQLQLKQSSFPVKAIELPIWKLVLIVAERLQAEVGDFRLQDIVEGVQRLDPKRQRNSISPVVQGMTSNAGMGPYSPCGEPLLRISHGLYRLVGSHFKTENGVKDEWSDASASTIWQARQIGSSQLQDRIIEVISEFSICLDTYDKQIPFKRVGQYAFHRATIDKRRSFKGVREALFDEEYLNNFYKTLTAWGIGKRASKIVSFEEFSARLQARCDEIESYEHLRLGDPNLDISRIATNLWQLIENLKIVKNRSLIVPGTKTLHHLLPDLVPPMDRAWTGAFFLWSMGGIKYEKPTFVSTFASFAEIAEATNPSIYVGEGWRTSPTKVLDNAVIGYCKLRGIAPRGA